MAFAFYHPSYYKKQKQKEPPSYKKDNLKPGEFNPKDIGIDGYEYEEDIMEDYKPTKENK